MLVAYRLAGLSNAADPSCPLAPLRVGNAKAERIRKARFFQRPVDLRPQPRHCERA